MTKSITANGQVLNIRTPQDNQDMLKNGEYKLRCLLYGRSGTGKSSMASTFPGKKGIIDTDNGSKVYRGDCESYEIPEDSTLEMLAKNKKPGTKFTPVAWNFACLALDQFLQDPAINCIVIDSFTTLADACMKQVLFEVNRIGQAPTFLEWSRQMSLLQEFLFKAFGSGKNVISIFHEDVEKDELTGQLWYLPLITGKLAKKIPGFHDEVYHMEPQEKSENGKVKVNYFVRTAASRLYVAKSRIASLVDVPPVMPANFQEITKELGIALLDAKIAGTPVSLRNATGVIK